MESNADLTERFRQRVQVLMEQSRRERSTLDQVPHDAGICNYDRLFDSLQAALHNPDCVEDDG